MRIIIVLLFIVSSCVGQNKEKMSNKHDNRDSISKAKKKSKDSILFKMNIGFDDTPVWSYARFHRSFEHENSIFCHIYGINYSDNEGNAKILYYEIDREKGEDNIISFSNCVLTPYPGDKTLKLIDKEGNSLLLFNVLENEDFRRIFKGKEFKRIPTVNMNNKNEKVSDYDVELNIVHKKENFYDVTIIHNGGINEYIFKSNNDLKESDLDLISYFDLISGKIYLLDRNLYLEKIDI